METTTSAALSITLPSDREIVLTRAFDAPRRLVFEAYTTPEHVRHWYGHRTSTLTACEIDLRVGGAWRYVLREADGEEYAFSGVYREVVVPERLVHTEVFEFVPDNEALVTVTFVEHGGRTTYTSTSLYDSEEARDAVLASGMESGAVESMDRLAEHLARNA